MINFSSDNTLISKEYFFLKYSISSNKLFSIKSLTFSGTYVMSYDSYFVVTVAHGMVGNCDSTKVVFEQELYDCIKLIDMNVENDYAIIQVEEIKERNAIVVESDLPKRNQWKKYCSYRCFFWGDYCSGAF